MISIIAVYIYAVYAFFSYDRQRIVEIKAYLINHLTKKFGNVYSPSTIQVRSNDYLMLFLIKHVCILDSMFRYCIALNYP